MDPVDISNSSRRGFLRTVPVAAAAGFTLASSSPLASLAAAQSPPASATPATYQMYTADSIAGSVKDFDAKTGTHTLFRAKNVSVYLESEVGQNPDGPEFEMHDDHDHIVQVLSGTTVYEMGGTPKGVHSVKPGDWRASASEGAATVTLNKGDMLIIPRTIWHKRVTTGSAIFTLITPMGPISA